ncbi:MAG: hypothetical protein IPQ08_09195 [Chitinophagaceae bacterium]|nr:hypothetical protein [Chitinophagaceae bacterium]
MKTKSAITAKAASRIQSAASKDPQSKSTVTGFYKRAQAAAAKGKGGWPSGTGKPSGGGRDNA